MPTYYATQGSLHSTLGLPEHAINDCDDVIKSKTTASQGPSVHRLFWSLVNHISTWDVIQSIKSLATLQGGTWLAELLSKVDHAMHAQPHNRSHFAAALDLVKLALLQDVTDPTAQAVRQVYSLMHAFIPACIHSYFHLFVRSFLCLFVRLFITL